MTIDNLQQRIDPGNTLEIEPGTQFINSQINVTGTGCEIYLGKTLSYEGLKVNLKGNNKKIVIQGGEKHIRGLKIVSIRGDRQSIEIGENLSCGGMEIQMNDGDESVSIGNTCLFSWDISIRTSTGTQSSI